MPNNGYFDIKRDAEGFLCQACVVGKTQNESSPDPRYCQNCYSFLLKEAEMLPGNKHPKWIPKPQDEKQVLQNNTIYKPTLYKENEVLAYLENEKVQLRQNLTEDRPKPNAGGRPRKDVPVDLIHKLFDSGLSVRKIMKELGERGQIISTRTIQRVLSGQRN
jgi:hypothetical protein